MTAGWSFLSDGGSRSICAAAASVASDEAGKATLVEASAVREAVVELGVSRDAGPAAAARLAATAIDTVIVRRPGFVHFKRQRLFSSLGGSW